MAKAKFRPRVSAIIIKNYRILLIFRLKKSREYWVFPGGGIEEDESGKSAIAREIKEETNLDLQEAQLLYGEFDKRRQRDNTFYKCTVLPGRVKLGGPEVACNSPSDYYKPQWVSLKRLPELKLYPASVKNLVIKLFSAHPNDPNIQAHA